MPATVQTKIETKDGEVTINLNLTIKLDSTISPKLQYNKDIEVKLDGTEFIRPDFEDNSQIIDFGKQV